LSFLDYNISNFTNLEMREIKRKIKVTKSNILLYDGKFCQTHRHFEGDGFHEKGIPNSM